MSMDLQDGMPLVNIVMAEVITEESEPQKFTFDTAEEAQIEPNLSEGEENILRVKNKILATNRTEDIVIGYDLTLTSNTLVPQLFALIDGGELVFDEEDKTKILRYEAPVAGKPVNRKRFTINIYTEEKDIDGETLQFVKFGFKHGKGKPVSFDLKDGEFFVPEMVVRSRPKAGERPIDMEFLDELPKGDTQVQTLL